MIKVYDAHVIAHHDGPALLNLLVLKTGLGRALAGAECAAAAAAPAAARTVAWAAAGLIS